MTVRKHHSNSEMGRRKHLILDHDGGYFPPEEAAEIIARSTERPRNEVGASYLNNTLLTASDLFEGDGDEGFFLIDRAWQKKSTASSTASNIRLGKIPGPFMGQPNMFDAIVVICPHDTSKWSVFVRRVS